MTTTELRTCWKALIYKPADYWKSISAVDDVNSPLGDDGATLLYFAVAREHLDIANDLIQRGADIHVLVNHETPLHTAARRNNPALTRLLLDEGANPHIPDTMFGSTPLFQACGYRNTLGIAQALLHAGADPNARNYVGVTPYETLTTLRPGSSRGPDWDARVHLFEQYGARVQSRTR